MTLEKHEEQRGDVATDSYSSLSLNRKFPFLANPLLVYKMCLVMGFTILKQYITQKYKVLRNCQPTNSLNTYLHNIIDYTDNSLWYHFSCPCCQGFIFPVSSILDSCMQTPYFICTEFQLDSIIYQMPIASLKVENTTPEQLLKII